MTTQTLNWDSFDRFESLNSLGLMPEYDKADTIQGEEIRAFNRMVYRYFNDGEYGYDTHSDDSATGAYNFLTTERGYAEFEGRGDDAYVAFMYSLGLELEARVLACNGKYEPNTEYDMLKYVNDTWEVCGYCGASYDSACTGCDCQDHWDDPDDDE